MINMDNEDDECFKWAVTRALNPVETNPGRVWKKKKNDVDETLRKQSEQLNWNGIEFPTPCSERFSRKFENNNDVSILVFGYSDNSIIPCSYRKTREGYSPVLLKR